MKTLLPFLFFLTIFASCSNDNMNSEVTIEDFPITSKRWGYFNGICDTIHFNVKNNFLSEKDSIYSIRQIIDDDNTSSDSINTISTGIMLPNNLKININIRNLHLGLKTTSSSQIINDNEAHIIIYKDETTYYQPCEEYPFQIEIIKSDWESELDPIIEVIIIGYLAKNTNTDEYIYIEAKYGTR